MSLATRITDLAGAIGLDIKVLTNRIGTLANLTTTDKTSLVLAINELEGEINTLQSMTSGLINDSAVSGDTTHTWSADKILSYTAQLKSDIMGGIPSAALDTIYELATQLTADGSAISNILTALGNRVRVDAVQSFDSTQQAQGRSNIGAASATDLQTLTDNVGDTAHDFVADYNVAKA